ncbi:RsfA family transcriptional regulator [Salibacterium halotolerans]|uniref:Prespore-specific regulator n=1 Tax=Salibacterium halotolerans TaxID=1884432 RepID=A0A1I5UDL5_9BACI|nr:RsfA family transcriptional regulator [Salibacterium halotolerans]SFP93341.1 prespore-specific regulator [Salibacterium halotolerans]
MNVRQDAWSDRDDRFLADTILQHIRDGSTQLHAFDEAGDELDRTSAACGFRWNAIVRARYQEDIREAKRERKQKLKNTARHAASSFKNNGQSSRLPLESIIKTLERLEYSLTETSEDTIARLESRHHELQQELDRMNSDYQAVKQDYETIVSMMNRAREMAVTEETNQLSNLFRMDRNGNLEKVENS